MAISSKIYKRCRAVSAFLAVLIAAAICGQSVFAGGLSGTIQLNCSIEQDGSVIDLSGDTYAVVQIAAAKEIHSTVTGIRSQTEKNERKRMCCKSMRSSKTC